jgi:small subunit ribosomal protein S8
MVTDPVADMLVRIGNAQQARKQNVVIPHSKFLLQIALLLKELGFLGDVALRGRKTNRAIKADLLSEENGSTRIGGMRRISKPGRRMWSGSRRIYPLHGGFVVLSTPQGVLTHKEARKRNVGGEVLFEIW